MKIRNIVIALLIATLFCLPVFSQGSKEETSSTQDKLIDITFWYNPANVEAGAPPADWFIYDRLKEELGINLILTALPSSATDRDVKMNAAGAANALPDMMHLRRPVMINLAKQGLLAPVDDMFEKMPERTAKMYNQDSFAYATYNGHIYGFVASTGDIKKNEGILIRKDWLDNLGLDIPVTLEDYMNVMRAFTYDDPDGNGKDDTYGYGTFIEITASEEGLGRRLDPFFGAFGCAGTWDLSKESAGLNILKPEYYDALNFIVQMNLEGVIDPNWLSQKKDDFKANWKQGKYGMMREQNASYAAESNYKPFDKNFPDGEWIVIAPPVGPEGKSAVGVYTNVNDGVIAINSKITPEKKDAIARMLEWMSGPGYYAIGWGEEGVNFIFDEEGVPTTNGLADPSKGFNKAEIVPLLQLKGLAYYWGEAELKSRYPSYITEYSKKPMSALVTLREMQAQPWIKQAGVDLLPLPNGDLKRYYEQSVAEFASGNKKLTAESWDAFIKQFKALGGQDWNDEGVKTAKELGILY